MTNLLFLIVDQFRAQCVDPGGDPVATPHPDVEPGAPGRVVPSFHDETGSVEDPVLDRETHRVLMATGAPWPALEEHIASHPAA